MKKRQEKGLFIMLIIIIGCLFLMMAAGGPFSQSKSTGEIAGEDEKRSGNGELSINQEMTDRVLDSEHTIYVPDQNIAVTDSLGVPEGEVSEETMSELTFLLNNFSFERSGSQILIGVVAALLIFYLVLIGPVCYLYLKKIRKMERMWILLPIISVSFGCVILLMSNDFIIREPYADVIKVVSPGEKTVCYGVATSPGDESYSLYFDDTVKSLQPWADGSKYVINEEKRSLTFRPDSAFEKEYFQFSMAEIPSNDFIHNIRMDEQGGTGILYNTTGYSFSHLILCYKDYYCILPSMNPGEEYSLTQDMWKKDEYGMTGSLKEELQMQAGLSIDEREVFDLAWYRHVNSDSEMLHIAGISQEGNPGLKENGVDLIYYSLFYR